MAPEQNSSAAAFRGGGGENKQLKDTAAFEAAAVEIKAIIGREGGVDSYRCAEVINEKADIARLVDRHFPGALSSAHVLEKVAHVIEKRGYTDDNTLFAQSVCPDEINHEEEDITDLFTKYLGEVFHLGGLAGVPFTGKTGFGAFSHHVPNDGHCFVMMAPHVGLDDTCNLGKYSREGQTHSGTACGAAIGALVHCCSGKPLPSLLDNPDDYQMAYLMHRIEQRKDKILENSDMNSKQAALATETHCIAKEMLDKIVNVEFGSASSTLVILTGIQINMPKPFDDYFQPLNFYILDKQGRKIDLFEETFGPVGPAAPVLLDIVQLAITNSEEMQKEEADASKEQRPEAALVSQKSKKWEAVRSKVIEKKSQNTPVKVTTVSKPAAQTKQSKYYVFESWPEDDSDAMFC